MGDFLIAFNGPDLIERLDVWGEAAVHTQDLLVDQLQEERHKGTTLMASSSCQRDPAQSQSSQSGVWGSLVFTLTAAIVSMSKTLVQYLHAFAFPYLVWHSSVKENLSPLSGPGAIKQQVRGNLLQRSSDLR